MRSIEPGILRFRVCAGAHPGMTAKKIPYPALGGFFESSAAIAEINGFMK